MAVHSDNYWLAQIATLIANAPIIVDAPTSATDTGTAGQMAYDSSYLYVCVDTDTWLRVAISTWT